MPTTLELATKLETLRTDYKTKWDGFAVKTLPNGESAKDIPGTELKTLEDMRADIDKTADEWTASVKADKFASDNSQSLADMAKPTNRLSHGGDPEKKVLSLAERFLNSDQFKSRTPREMKEVGFDDFDVKSWMAGTERKATMLTTANGYSPEVLRTGGVTFSAQAPPQIIDTLPMRPTTQTGLAFMTETVFTNTAASKAETGDAVEATLTYAETTGPIVRVPVFIPVSEIQLADVPGLEQIIGERLVLMVKQQLDAQVMTKSGAGTDMTGMENASGVQSQALGVDNRFDAIYKGILKVRTTGWATPGIIYMHANDWMDFRLARTADGLYILGNPDSTIVPRLWGLPVIENTVSTENTATVADVLNHVTLVMRTGIDIAISDSHASLFIAGTLAIRATVRAGLEIRRGAAICKVTGL